MLKKSASLIKKHGLKALGVCSVALLTSFTASFTTIQAWSTQTDGAHAFWALVYTHRVVMVWVLAGIVVTFNNLIPWYQEHDAKARAVQRYLNTLHNQISNRVAGLDPDYRLTLFCPGWVWHDGWLRLRWKCLYRTGGGRTTRTFSPERLNQPNGRVADGVVGFIRVFGFSPQVAGLKKDPDEDEIRQYCVDTQIDRSTYDSLSWPGCQIQGAILKISHADDPIGVLIIENRKHSSKGKPIALNPTQLEVFNHGVVNCTMVMEGRL